MLYDRSRKPEALESHNGETIYYSNNIRNNLQLYTAR